jgi:amidophosphoribosyltransferase
MEYMAEEREFTSTEITRAYRTSGIREECGVFGIYSPAHENITEKIYYGLTALQHRGQESAGIAVSDTEGLMYNVSFHKDMGLVSEVFHKEDLLKLKGNIGVGHVRYSTAGGSTPENAQPLVINYSKGTLSLVHNGNITNADELRYELSSHGAVFHATSDSEVIASMIAFHRTRSAAVEEAIKKTAERLKGGYALIVMSPRKIIGVRDPYGLKPLCLGKISENGNDTYILASESCALTSIDAQFIRDIEPGEIITITKDGLKTDHLPAVDKKAHCIFEYIYFARLDSVIDNISVYGSRIKAGQALAENFPVKADLVAGVPDSGLAAAEGYAMKSGIPFRMIFKKNSYVGRTFIKPTQEMRESAVHIKLNVISETVKGKDIVLIDDSIVRGTTMKQIIKQLKKNGAGKIHVRISAPPFLHPCYYGTDVPTSTELIAHNATVDDICSFIGADSLGYLDVSDFQKMVGDLPICKACFDGNYPVM